MSLEKTLSGPPFHASQALLQQLRDLKRRDEEADVESSQARIRWLEGVEALLSGVRAWLAPAASEGLVRIDGVTVHVSDDDVGAYDAPALKLSFPAGRVVWVRPVGTLRVGAQGIVDVVCGSNRVLLVLNRAGVWKIRPVGPSASLAALDGETFARALGDLLL